MLRRRPVIVAVYGALRSGTTLLRIMLHGHPALACPGETDFLFDHLPSGAGADTPYDTVALENDRIYRAYAARLGVRPLAALTPAGLVGNIAGPNQIAVLMIHRHPDRLLASFPRIPVIHLLRDPRDVARSSMNMGWAGTAYHGVDHWCRTEDAWAQVQDRLAPGQTLDIRYEELVSDPTETLTRVCSFLGVAYDPAMLDYEGRSTYSRPNSALSEQWRRKMTPREIELVEHRLGPRLVVAGYASASNVEPNAPSWAEALALWLANKRGIWTHRFQRYGLIDPLLVALARRLGWASLGRAAQRRIDAQVLAYLK